MAEPSQTQSTLDPSERVVRRQDAPQPAPDLREHGGHALHMAEHAEGLRERIVRQLRAHQQRAAEGAQMRLALSDPASKPKPFHEALQPRSTFWRARVEDLRFANDNLSELRNINTGVDDVLTKVGSIQFPTSIGVTMTMSPEDAVIDRMVTAVEKIAKTLPGRGGDCAELTTMSPSAFVLVARLTTLASHLMDRRDVSAGSTFDKLANESELINDVRRLLQESKLDLLPHFDSAVDPKPFDTPDRNNDRSHWVFDELQKRAAVLLAIKCLVATQLEGDSPEWPPQAPTPGPLTLGSQAQAAPTRGAANAARRRTRKRATAKAARRRRRAA